MRPLHETNSRAECSSCAEYKMQHCVLIWLWMSLYGTAVLQYAVCVSNRDCP
jgi:hypothetical protein